MVRAVDRVRAVFPGRRWPENGVYVIPAGTPDPVDDAYTINVLPLMQDGMTNHAQAETGTAMHAQPGGQLLYLFTVLFVRVYRPDEATVP